MRHRGRAVGLHEDRHLPRARAYYVELRGEASAAERAREIAALSTKVWRGHLVYRVVCRADFGVGPHTMFVPERVLWLLVDLRAFTCAWHR